MSNTLPSAFTASGFTLQQLGSGRVPGYQTFGDVTGDLNDRVVLVVNGQTILCAQTYDVRCSVLTQPSQFTLTMGWGDVLSGLIPLVQPNFTFQLLVGTTPKFTGAVDGYEAVSDGGSGGTLTVHGRDNLAPIHDTFITKEESFDNATYAQMVQQLLDKYRPGYKLVFTNDANRKLTSGVGIPALREPSVDPTQAASGPTAKQLRTRVGERLYEFIKRQLDRAGLFLWAAADGTLVLSEPNGNQSPSYQIVRQRGLTRNAVNVTSARHRNATEGRYSHATVYGKGGGKKFGRTKASGGFVDEEMVGYGFQRELVLRDANVRTPEQAEFYARRKVAETRRAGWSLEYVAAGHTVPSLATGGRAVWSPDTVVAVVDQELNLTGNYYVEQCVYRRDPKTSTTLTLQRPEDLVFALGEAEG